MIYSFAYDIDMKNQKKKKLQHGDLDTCFYKQHICY